VTESCSACEKHAEWFDGRVMMSDELKQHHALIASLRAELDFSREVHHAIAKDLVKDRDSLRERAKVLEAAFLAVEALALKYQPADEHICPDVILKQAREALNP